MKILYIVNARIPTEKAHGIQIMKMCEAFADLGHDVELVIPNRKNEIKADPFTHYSVRRNFRITKLFTIDLLEWNWLELAAYWIQVFVFLLSSKLYLRKTKGGAVAVYSRDLYMAAFFRGINIELHSVPRGNQRFMSWLFGRCGRLIVLTDFIKNRIAGLGIPAERIFVAPDAVDLKIFDIDMKKEDARKKLGLPDEAQILVYTGKFKTMGMDKGINDILVALKFLDNKVAFVAVGGETNDIEYYRRAALNLDVLGRVKLLPSASQATLATYQKAADVLLMPFPNNEHYAYFMSPLKLFEYMASGRPIVASDLPSIRGILNESNSVICKPDNPESLAESISKLLNDKDLAGKISSRAFADVAEHTWQKRAGRIIVFLSD